MLFELLAFAFLPLAADLAVTVLREAPGTLRAAAAALRAAVAALRAATDLAMTSRRSSRLVGLELAGM